MFYFHNTIPCDYTKSDWIKGFQFALISFFFQLEKYYLEIIIFLFHFLDELLPSSMPCRTGDLGRRVVFQDFQSYPPSCINQSGNQSINQLTSIKIDAMHNVQGTVSVSSSDPPYKDGNT